METKSSKPSSTDTNVQTMADEIPSVKYTATQPNRKPSEPVRRHSFPTPDVREANGDMSSFLLSTKNYAMNLRLNPAVLPAASLGAQ
jgi:hypothetical protein